jgi:hypothetical protein
LEEVYMENQFPPNNKASRVPPTEDAAEAVKVISGIGTVKRRKKPIGQRLKEIFIGDNASSVMGYVMLEVVVPAIKDTLSDVVTQAVERMLFGEVRSSTRRPNRGGSSGGYVAYNRYSSGTVSRQEPARPNLSPRARANHDFDEIIIPDRPRADEVLDRMYDLLSRYEQVTVANLYELVGFTPEFTDGSWGWTSLEGSGVRRVREGFLIDLPRPEPLRK